MFSKRFPELDFLFKDGEGRCPSRTTVGEPKLFLDDVTLRRWGAESVTLTASARALDAREDHRGSRAFSV
jgi:hypothetical protein